MTNPPPGSGTGGFPVPPKVGHQGFPHPQRPHPHKTLRPTKPPHKSGPHPKRKPWPVTVTVKAMPALAGVHFRFDNRILTTGANGIATYTAEHDFALHTLTVTDSAFSTADSRYQFTRWVGQRDPNAAFSKTVSGLPLRANYAVTAAFGLQQSFLPKLVNQNGVPVDPARVSSITVKSDTGQLIELNPSSPTMLEVSRPAIRHGVLVTQPAIYSLQSVIVRGTNVVDSGRQSFRPGGDVTFVTQFHDLVITGRDALFGSTRGVAAVVTYPDGGQVTIPFDAQHRAVLLDVPRGPYKASIKAGHAIVAKAQFIASKDKTISVSVISMPDMAVLGGSGLVVALGLLLVGRLRGRRGIIRRFRRSLDNAPLLPPAKEKALL
ncbi:MAG TPA: hypothetical protein VJ851_06315 [Jatrophihabitans sp.]|nr:hypothetical protein [Jatrophihabitans sp.]